MMSAGRVVTGRRLVLPPYPPGSLVYAVYGNTTNSIDEMRTFEALYLRPNDEEGGHFVHNIQTMQENSTCRVIGSNKKPIPMTDLIINVINQQAAREQVPEDTEFGDIDGSTTVRDYNEDGDDSEFDEDDKSYETSDDSTIDGDHDVDDEQVQQEEDQQQYFNVTPIQEVNEDSADEGVSESDEESITHPGQPEAS